MSDYKMERLGALVLEMNTHWSLERVSSSLWCVYDTDTGETLSGRDDPAEAIFDAIHGPLSDAAQAYFPRFGWGLIGKVFELK